MKNLTFHSLLSWRTIYHFSLPHLYISLRKIGSRYAFFYLGGENTSVYAHLACLSIGFTLLLLMRCVGKGKSRTEREWITAAAATAPQTAPEVSALWRTHSAPNGCQVSPHVRFLLAHITQVFVQDAAASFPAGRKRDFPPLPHRQPANGS